MSDEDFHSSLNEDERSVYEGLSNERKDQFKRSHLEIKEPLEHV